VVLINATTMQATAKIVYYGPGLGGKTTNLQYVHAKTAPGSRGELVSLETESDRTLFFDLLPLEVGVIKGMRVRLQLYTVPGQVFYNATRQLVLRGADAVVFVADSQLGAREANRESLRNLRENLAELGSELDSLPLVFQYNKRDLPDILARDELERDLNPGGAPCFEAAALHGVGVFETLKGVTRETLAALRRRIGAELPAARAPVAAAVPEPASVEFAEENTGATRLRAVETRAGSEIDRTLERLRAVTPVAAPGARPPDVSAIERQVRLRVPGDRLASAQALGVHVSLAGEAVSLYDVTSLRLPADRARRILVRLELVVEGEPDGGEAPRS
jgi:GTPase SAR1 family protein